MTDECPDCGNKNLTELPLRFDIITKEFKSSKKCPQCRRWLFDE